MARARRRLATSPGAISLRSRETKEPGSILYFTPTITPIVNMQDQSFTLTPEVVYTGFTTWELRRRVMFLQGARFTEFGERTYDYRIERYARAITCDAPSLSSMEPAGTERPQL
jgi:hypothetical protein